MAVPNHDIREQIGEGGMATVYRAEHVLLKQERALKLMSPALSREPGFQESFLREGQTVAGLQHPNIVTLHDIGQCEDGYFMSMEYLRGGSLQARLKASRCPWRKR
ncbi:MAG: protein kinase [Candidatus Thiothrix singaporensis]|uniref:Protein kinase n=1 Tax=Candidatus Thiothrix singaporensis TaxID=2799669 RepID=A0A7L6AWX0_9GAMM|nr:MAG: protein kinase [Candidatus Thiothrix singaporensis]